MRNRNDQHPEAATAAAAVIQQELQGVLGEPDRRQRELIANLDRLHRSLVGPEDPLDQTSYSRPFPPPHRHPSTGTADRAWKEQSRTLDIPEE